jgi:hypothetical protein
MTYASSVDQTVQWRIASILLLAAWIITAILNMRHVHVPFVTTHLADVVLPAWVYIGLRGLDGWQRGQRWSLGLLTRNPEVTAGVLIAGSTMTELSQKYWPVRPFQGTFDAIDVLAFAVGIGACYGADKLALRRQTLWRDASRMRPRAHEREATPRCSMRQPVQHRSE